MPEQPTKYSHLLALFIFALPFVIRPLGGYVFGIIADKKAPLVALDATLQYASLASLAIAILPGYSAIGFLATALFITFRALQGFALGGEYTTAGTFLMDKYQRNQSFISGILGASGTIGSIIAFSFSLLYANYYQNTDVWRLFFVFGAVATYLSRYMRKRNRQQLRVFPPATADKHPKPAPTAALKTMALGAVTSVSCFVPMVYTNFYFTKVLNLDFQLGMAATLTSLVTYVICTPLVGLISDRVQITKYLSYTFICALPFVAFGFTLVCAGNILGQIALTLAASIVGANIHVIMNQLFPVTRRSRSVNFYFAVGASLGGLVPALSGFIQVHHNFVYTPIISLNFLILLNAFLFAGTIKRGTAKSQSTHAG